MSTARSRSDLEALASQASKCCLLSLVLLLVLFLWQTVIVWPVELQVRLAVFTVQLLPFLLVLKGLLQQRWRSYIWMIFFLQLYFISAVLKLFADPGLASAWIFMALLVMIFTSALLFVRWARLAEVA